MLRYETASFEASYGFFEQLPPSEEPEIAFAGRSNVGKSSLLNRLFNRKNLARVSSVPGKTVTINFYDVDKVKFVDLPGYGYAKVSFDEKKRWAELMEGYFNSGRNIRLVVQLTDMRRSVTDDDLSMMDFMKPKGIKFLVVMTKSDKLNKTEYAKRTEEIKDELKGYENVQVIAFSALNGDGTESLKSEIEKALL